MISKVSTKPTIKKVEIPSSNQHNWLTPLAIFMVLTGIFLFFHEPWRDEVRDFAVAISSNSFTELMEFSQYDGHPGLWYWILYGISQFTSSIFAVQVINMLIMSTGVYVLLRYAPIQWAWKILMIFGYFFLYEYSILFRSYATGITLLFIICEMINREKLILASALIMVVVNANIFAFFIGGALWLICIIGFFRTYLKQLLLGSVLVVLGLLRSVMDTIPPKDYGISIGYEISIDGLAGGLANVWRAFIPIPMVNTQYWNSNFINHFLEAPFGNYLMSFGALFIILACLIQLRKSTLASAFFLLLIGTIVGFTGIIYPGSLRHHGHLYIAFIIALWLKEIFANERMNIPFLNKGSLPISLGNNQFLKGFFPAIFYFHILASSIAWFYDSQHVFSKGKEVAAYIKAQKLDSRELIGHYDANVSTVAVYLNQPMYFPQSNRTATFIIWDRNRNNPISYDDLGKLLAEKRKSPKGALLVSSLMIPEAILKKYNITLMKEFAPSLQESYFLYE